MDKMGKTVKLDFDPIINYFKNLKQDMQIAWGVLAFGIIILIIGLILL